MFQKIYIHNYRCFQNFELDTSELKTLLILGKNGTGKSTLLNAFTILRDIAYGENQLDKLFSEDDFNTKEQPITFDIDVLLKSQNYHYKFSVYWSDEFKRVKINSEELLLNNKVIFSRDNLGEISFNHSNFIIDWHSAALPLLISKNKDTEINLTLFRNWLSSMVLIAPVPSLITSFSEKEDSVLGKDTKNFVNWFRWLYTSSPNLYIEIYNHLKNIFNDFYSIELQPYGNNTKALELKFKHKKDLTLKFERLSDGEKVLIIAATIISLTTKKEPIFCFWDEPDNYISIAIVETLISYLKGRFDRSEAQQIFITSHDELVINSFPLSKIKYFYRNSHLEPTRIKLFENKDEIVNVIKFGELE